MKLKSSMNGWTQLFLLDLQLLAPKVGDRNLFIFVQPLMEYLNMKLGSSKRGQTQIFCLASKFWRWKFKAKQGNLVPDLSWNPRHMKFREFHEGRAKTFAMTSNGVPEQVVQRIHERSSARSIFNTFENGWAQKHLPQPSTKFPSLELESSKTRWAQNVFPWPLYKASKLGTWKLQNKPSSKKFFSHKWNF